MSGVRFCALAGALVPLPGVFPGHKTDRHGKGVQELTEDGRTREKSGVGTGPGVPHVTSVSAQGLPTILEGALGLINY